MNIVVRSIVAGIIAFVFGYGAAALVDKFVQNPELHNGSHTVIDGRAGKVVVGKIVKEAAGTMFALKTESGQTQDVLFISSIPSALDEIAPTFDNVEQVKKGVVFSCQTTVTYIGEKASATKEFPKREYISTGEETGLGFYAQIKYLGLECMKDYQRNSYL